jgi:kinetochore protein Mis12/MTW1
MQQRRLKRMYFKALRISRLGLLRSQRELDRLSHFHANNAQTLRTLQALPPQLTALFESAAALPHMDGMGGALQRPIPDPSKRVWETGGVGYTSWAVQQLLLGRRLDEKEGEGEGDASFGNGALWNAVDRAERVAGLAEIKELASDLKDENEGEEVQGRREEQQLVEMDVS